MVDGEICVQGPGIFAGYDGDAAATAIALPDGWLHTGDCGHLDEAGFLVIDGRLKEMINRGGEKIAPDAIEAVLGTCPGIQEVAVFAVPDDRLGEEVAAAVVLSPGAELSDDDLWDFCQERLAEFETPKHWQRLVELPRGGTGKVLRRLLKEHWPHGH
jgi:acyl-CoA synthetase (AMP-forming)/AMP-acid ligase II